MNSKALKFLVFTVILGVYGAFALQKIALPTNDLGLRLKVGEVAWETKSLPRTNLFSYTEPGHPFMDRFWLHGLIFHSVRSVSGFEGLVVFKTLVLLAAFLILFLAARKRAGFWPCALVSMPAILILNERTDIRPEIFTYFFIAVFYYFLLDAEDRPESNRLFGLVPCQALWANLHLFFLTGMLLAAGFLFERMIRAFADRESMTKDPLIKKLLLLLPLLAAACCCTLDGPRGLFSLVGVIRTSSFYEVGENLPISQYLRSYPELGVPIWTFLLTLPVFLAAAVREFRTRSRTSLSVIRAFADMPVCCLLACAGGAAAGLMFRRGIAVFAMTLVPALSASLSGPPGGSRPGGGKSAPAEEKRPGRLFIAAFAALFLYFIYPGLKAARSPEFGAGLTPGSEGAAEFFRAQGLKGPIFNDYNIGGYLIYGLYPGEKVFMDVRGGDAYSRSFFQTVYKPIMKFPDAWAAMLAKYDFNALFFDYEDKFEPVRYFLTMRANDPAWALVYADRYAVIFLRIAERNRRVIEKFRIHKDNIGERTAPLLLSRDPEAWINAADLCNLFGRWDLARPIFRKVLAARPDYSLAWLVAGETEVTAADEESRALAVTYLEKAVALGRREAEAYAFLGFAYIKAGERAKARPVLEKALRLDPGRGDIRTILDALDQSLEIQFGFEKPAK